MKVTKLSIEAYNNFVREHRAIIANLKKEGKVMEARDVRMNHKKSPAGKYAPTLSSVNEFKEVLGFPDNIYINGKLHVLTSCEITCDNDKFALLDDLKSRGLYELSYCSLDPYDNKISYYESADK